MMALCTAHLCNLAALRAFPAQRGNIVIGRFEAHSTPAKDANVRRFHGHSDATRNGALE